MYFVLRLNPEVEPLPEGYCSQYKVKAGNVLLAWFLTCPRRHDCTLCRGLERFEAVLNEGGCYG